jgi:protein-tyrosine phosphatase
MRARQVEASDFDRFTWILAMDDANLRDLRARAPAGCRATIHKVRAPVGGGDVPDPYYGGADGFDRVHGLLTEAIAAWISRLPPP